MKQLSILLASSLAFAASSFGQSTSGTATTDPVGYMTLTVAGGTQASPKLTLLTPTLVNPVAWQGVITAISATSITVTGTTAPWTANQFNGANGAHYVEIISGTTGAGAIADITATSGTSITLAENLTSFGAAGSSIRIRKHITISDFLGVNNSAGLLEGTEVGNADQVMVYNGSVPTVYWYYNGTEGGSEGWVDTNFNYAPNAIIAPGQGVIIKRIAASNLSFQITGSVKTGATILPVLQNLNVLGVVSAAGMTLNSSSLFTGNATTGIRAGTEPGTSDLLTIYTSNSITPYFYYDGTEGGAAGWYDTAWGSAGTTQIQPGSSFTLKRISPGVPFNWQVPAVTIN